MFKDSLAFSGFSVSNQKAAKEFYGGVLGLNVKDGPMGLELHIAGSTPIFVYEKADHAPASFTVLNFPVSNINEAVDALVAKGVNMETYPDLPAPQDERGILRGLSANMGPDIAWFKDPSGNVLAVMQQA